MSRKRHTNQYLVSQPFVIENKPVRLVAYDWRSDSTYRDVTDVDEVLQVTWGDYPNIEAGWIANIELRDNGSWYAGEKEIAYPSAEDAAFAAVMDWIAYKRKLTDVDYQRLFDAYVASLTPGVKKLKRKLLR